MPLFAVRIIFSTGKKKLKPYNIYVNLRFTLLYVQF